MKPIFKLIPFCILLGISICNAQTGNASTPDRQQFASLGNFKLESGQIIQDCKIGYRTYGRLNSAKSNAILFPTWFTGTAKQIEYFDPWQTIDTTRFYLIVVDALGNGISSSPSNSVKQHGPAFPHFSIRDMVESQYQMLTKKLNIQQLYTVMGASMGAIQTFQWAVSYPGFAKHYIPVSGSPQPSGYDLMVYNTVSKIIEADSAFNHGNYKVNPPIAPASMLIVFSGATPELWVKTVSHDKFPAWMQSVSQTNFDWNDAYYQITAVIGHDISKQYNGSMQEAAKHIQGKMLIIVSKQDHLVNPQPAIDFSKLLPAKLLVLDSNLGHGAANFNDPQVHKSIMDELADGQ